VQQTFREIYIFTEGQQKVEEAKIIGLFAMKMNECGNKRTEMGFVGERLSGGRKNVDKLGELARASRNRGGGRMIVV
jgi:hypothetical protein